MKRKLIALTTMIFTFLALTGICQAQTGFKLKFAGGYGTMKTGDFNTFGQDFDTYLGDLLAVIEALSGTGGTQEGEFKKVNMGIEAEGELILSLMGGVGIGLGAGYIKRKNESDMSISHPIFGDISTSLKPDFTVTPVTLSLYFSPPAIAPMNFYVFGGVGYYLGKATTINRIDYELTGFFPFWAMTTADIKDRGIGFHGGVGLEFKLIPKVALFIEGKARYCKLTSWEGDETYEDSDGYTEDYSGTMWYYEEQNIDTGLWYAEVELSEDEPTWADIRNVRKFEVDLTGFSIRAGIRIKF